MKYTQLNLREFEVHSIVLDRVREGTKALELGCATGYFSEMLNKKGIRVLGVEYEKEAAKKAKEWCEKVIVADLEDASKVPLKEKFDYVLLMDVIEHIVHRDQLITKIQDWLAPEGKLILTTPNIAHLSIRLKLLFGDFTYTQRGLLDETHVHFFTQQTLVQFLKFNGYKIDEITSSADFGQMPLIGRFLKHIPKGLQYHITQLLPTLLGVQWIISASAAHSV